MLNNVIRESKTFQMLRKVENYFMPGNTIKMTTLLRTGINNLSPCLLAKNLQSIKPGGKILTIP
jgi:hypothetical protein